MFRRSFYHSIPEASAGPGGTGYPDTVAAKT